MNNEEAVSDEVVLAFRLSGSNPITKFHERGAYVCTHELGLTPYPGRLGLHGTLKGPFQLNASRKATLLDRIDRLFVAGALPAIEVTVGSVERFNAPEQVVYVPLYGLFENSTADLIYGVLEDLEIPPLPFDRKTGHASFAKRKDADSPGCPEGMDLIFGVYHELCPWHHCSRTVSLTELALFDRRTAQPVRTWTLPH